MKQTILLFLLFISFTAAVNAQKKNQRITAYAITAPQKGSSNWTDVRLVDITTGEEVQSVYESNQERTLLNARTGKPIIRKDASTDAQAVKREFVVVEPGEKFAKGELQSTKRKVIILNADDNNAVRQVPLDGNGVENKHSFHRRIITYSSKVQTDKPFATNSAACAYDKKHERLYYTPMGINQLRYIDLKSKNQAIYYFEDEPFGAVKGRHDVPNQITRMVIAKDGNGYALSNNAEHLIRFTTKRKPEITDLGAITDDASNAFSIKGHGGFGGDMIASESGALYLITANRGVFKIDIDKKIATYKGSIKGLPRGFSTNGAIVEKGNSVIVSSASSTMGYYKFDMNTLQAEKMSTAESVFNASDLANATLLADKKNKDEEQAAVVAEEAVATTTTDKTSIGKSAKAFRISVYPNPVTNGRVNLMFKDLPKGRYQVQFLDISGKIISTENVAVNFQNQVKEFRLSQLMSKGNYLVKVVGEGNKVSSVEQLVVQ